MDLLDVMNGFQSTQKNAGMCWKYKWKVLSFGKSFFCYEAVCRERRLLTHGGPTDTGSLKYITADKPTNGQLSEAYKSLSFYSVFLGLLS